MRNQNATSAHSSEAGSVIRCYPSELQASAVLMMRAHSAMAQELLTLERSTLALQALWTGEAAGAYEVAQRKWRQTMATMTAILVAAAKLANAAQHAYALADQDAARRWG